MSNIEIRDYGTILSVTDTGEKNKLVNIFLQNHGVIKALAFGAKNSKKRFGGNLEPYHLQYFNISQKKQFYFISEAKIVKLFLDIRTNLLSIEMLQNISRLLIMIPVLDSQGLFKLFYFLLTKLNKREQNEEMFKAYYLFLIYFLRQEGFFSQSAACFECGKKGENSFLLTAKNEPQFLCNNCISNIDLNCLLTDKETSDFITNSLKSSKALFCKTYNKKTYDFLCKIITLLISHNFHIHIKNIPYSKYDFSKELIKSDINKE